MLKLYLIIIFFFSFGVCCLFIVTATGTTISQNCTYIRNPSFPSVYSASSALSYTVSKCTTGESSRDGKSEIQTNLILISTNNFYQKSQLKVNLIAIQVEILVQVDLIAKA